MKRKPKSKGSRLKTKLGLPELYMARRKQSEKEWDGQLWQHPSPRWPWLPPVAPSGMPASHENALNTEFKNTPRNTVHQPNATTVLTRFENFGLHYIVLADTTLRI